MEELVRFRKGEAAHSHIVTKAAALKTSNQELASFFNKDHCETLVNKIDEAIAALMDHYG